MQPYESSDEGLYETEREQKRNQKLIRRKHMKECRMVFDWKSFKLLRYECHPDCELKNDSYNIEGLGKWRDTL